MKTGKAPKQNKTMAHRLADDIREAIISAQLDLGEALSEEGLAAAFAVSRTPIREALTLLETQGLVTIVPKSGTYVFQPDAQDITELCEHRAALESTASRLAMARHPEALLADLRVALQGMQDARVAGDMNLYGRADTALHLAFFQHCDNRYLQEAYQRNLGRVAALRTHLASRARNEPARSFDDHQRIIDMVEQGKANALGSLLARHIMRTRENYINALRIRQEGESASSRTVQMRKKLGLG